MVKCEDVGGRGVISESKDLLCPSLRRGQVVQVRPILTPEAGSLSWIPVAGMERSAWSTRAAPKVICLLIMYATK